MANLQTECQTLQNHLSQPFCDYISSCSPALGNYFNLILPGAEKEVVIEVELTLNERWREMVAVL